MAGEKNMVILASSYNIGGFEIKLDYLIRNLDKKKFNITFLLVYPLYKARHLPEEVRNKYRAFLSWDEVNLIELDMKYRYDVSLIFKVAGLLRKMQADILYYTSLGAGTFIAPAAALIAGVGYKVKEVQTILKGQYPAPLRGIDQYLTSRMDRVIVASYFLRDLLVRKLHLTPAKIQVVPNGIDLQKFRKTAVKSGLKEQMDLQKKRWIKIFGENLMK